MFSLIFSFSIFSCPLFIRSVCFNRAYIFLSSFNLFQLTNTKTSDNKSTLLHFLVQSIESKCPEVLNLKEEIPSVPTAAKGKVLTLSLYKVKKTTVACKTYVVCKIQHFLTNLIPPLVLHVKMTVSLFIGWGVYYVLENQLKCVQNVWGSVHRDGEGPFSACMSRLQTRSYAYLSHGFSRKKRDWLFAAWIQGNFGQKLQNCPRLPYVHANNNAIEKPWPRNAFSGISDATVLIFAVSLLVSGQMVACEVEELAGGMKVYWLVIPVSYLFWLNKHWKFYSSKRKLQTGIS